MNFYKDYHFYIALCAFIVLFIGVLTDYFGILINLDAVETIMSYLLSFLIAFNVININVKKDTEALDIKNDIKQQEKSLKTLAGKNCKDIENNSEQEENMDTK